MKSERQKLREELNATFRELALCKTYEERALCEKHIEVINKALRLSK